MRTLILRTTTRVLTPIILVVSVYLLLRGHDAPGGGFIGGLVAGAAVVLHFLSYGPGHTLRMMPVSAGTMLGAGVALAVSVGLVALAAGGEFLEGAVWKTTVPVLGELKATASLIFDLGVFFVVIGTIQGFVGFLGEEHSEVSP